MGKCIFSLSFSWKFFQCIGEREPRVENKLFFLLRSKTARKIDTSIRHSDDFIVFFFSSRENYYSFSFCDWSLRGAQKFIPVFFGRQISILIYEIPLRFCSTQCCFEFKGKYLVKQVEKLWKTTSSLKMDEMWKVLKKIQENKIAK